MTDNEALKADYEIKYRKEERKHLDEMARAEAKGEE